ncbi:MAG: aminotransferase class I/II-fold pyridoxal phosphate-dependent enzyme [Clostridioides sp.]|nr:aminotransferase class I/II-fold pyridoxal phosphate-dependent enzyme [Clostridioides sp.]
MNTYIVNKLRENKNNDIISFHMPGHKNGKIYARLGYSDIMQDMYKFDTTEIIGTDNLHSPEGIIKKSQDEIAAIFGAKSTMFLVNGTTCGIQASILTACHGKNKKKIIVNRDCHQSVVNACLISGIEPVYIPCKINRSTNALEGVDVDMAKELIEKNRDASAVILTYPTYYGQTYNLEDIVKFAHNKGMMVIVDEAHGSHLDLSERLPETALRQGADISVQSWHKTLPAFTQASVLHVGKNSKADELRLRDYLRILESSSPSYVLMSSLEIAGDICDRYGKKLMEDLLEYIDEFKNKFEYVCSCRRKLDRGNSEIDSRELGNSEYAEKKTIGKNIKFYEMDDATKIFISAVELGISGGELEEMLRGDYNIQVELSNYYGVLLICTIGNDVKDFETMAEALEEIESKYVEKKSMSKIKDINFPNKISERKLLPSEAFDISSLNQVTEQIKSVKIIDSVGKISAESVVPYPPGICLIAPGEVIDQEMVDYINLCRENGLNITGIQDKTIENIRIIEIEDRV